MPSLGPLMYQKFKIADPTLAAHNKCGPWCPLANTRLLSFWFGSSQGVPQFTGVFALIRIFFQKKNLTLFCSLSLSSHVLLSFETEREYIINSGNDHFCLIQLQGPDPGTTCTNQIWTISTYYFPTWRTIILSFFFSGEAMQWEYNI